MQAFACLRGQQGCVACDGAMSVRALHPSLQEQGLLWGKCCRCHAAGSAGDQLFAPAQHCSQGPEIGELDVWDLIHRQGPLEADRFWLLGNHGKWWHSSSDALWNPALHQSRSAEQKLQQQVRPLETWTDNPILEQNRLVKRRSQQKQNLDAITTKVCHSNTLCPPSKHLPWAWENTGFHYCIWHSLNVVIPTKIDS